MTAPLTPARLSEIRARVEAATAGPWEADEPETWASDEIDNPQSRINLGDNNSLTWDDHSGLVFKPSDAAFIAAARQDVPDLLAEVDRLTAALASERAKTAAAQEVMDEHRCGDQAESAYTRALAAEATIARAMRISERPEVVPIEDAVRRHAFLKGYEQSWDAFRTHLDAAPTAAFDAALAEARAGAQKEMLAWLDLRIDAEELDMAAEIFGVDMTWANRPARAARIRKTQK